MDVMDIQGAPQDSPRPPRSPSKPARQQEEPPANIVLEGEWKGYSSHDVALIHGDMDAPGASEEVEDAKSDAVCIALGFPIAPDTRLSSCPACLSSLLALYLEST